MDLKWSVTMALNISQKSFVESILKPANEAIGTLAYSTSPTALDELSGTPITADDVGPVPTDDEMLNGGSPSVDHGVIIFQAP